MTAKTRTRERKATGISILVALQALACAFFLADLAGDVLAEGIGLHLAIEAMAAVALLAAVVLGALQVRSLLAAARRDEAAVAAAQGALAELIRLRFEEWQLTAAEADVALFALKGCDIGEIAGLRRVCSRHRSGATCEGLRQGGSGFAVRSYRVVSRGSDRCSGRIRSFLERMRRKARHPPPT